jgi:RNA polymerase sigma factor (sigma-70 family)
MRDADGGFLEAYEEHVFRVYGFFAYRLGSPVEAEDLTQATFERALRAWERYDPARAGLATWLLSIAQNLLIDHFRRGAHAAIPVAPDELPDFGGGPEMPMGVDPDLAAALATLSEREREVLALRFGGDLSGPEIADVTGLTVANVHQLLSRSLRRLRTQLDPG